MDPYLIPYININSEWTDDLNVGAKTIKCIEEKRGVSLHVSVVGKGFLEDT